MLAAQAFFNFNGGEVFVVIFLKLAFSDFFFKVLLMILTNKRKGMTRYECLTQEGISPKSFILFFYFLVYFCKWTWLFKIFL